MRFNVRRAGVLSLQQCVRWYVKNCSIVLVLVVAVVGGVCVSGYLHCCCVGEVGSDVGVYGRVRSVLRVGLDIGVVRFSPVTVGAVGLRGGVWVYEGLVECTVLGYLADRASIVSQSMCPIMQGRYFS